MLNGINVETRLIASLRIYIIPVPILKNTSKKRKGSLSGAPKKRGPHKMWSIANFVGWGPKANGYRRSPELAEGIRR